eukprot:CAMPEP_0181442740 /NCGR_PEP_ID=MMETSP1110-20121109/24186_1 /TAXON_ID=174948 /ORGANISM="Symbiodinium sp., Strain CCMP421" /LENGTH=78 /DNA_ID=CAMNT_0023566679 /DNA_START=38 /DNA_END=274 /DNA_ORIENTATION=-
MGLWAKAVAEASKKEKDPHEANKLAKRLYHALRKKAMKKEGAAPKGMKAMKAAMKAMKAMKEMKAMKAVKAMKAMKAK